MITICLKLEDREVVIRRSSSLVPRLGEDVLLHGHIWEVVGVRWFLDATPGAFDVMIHLDTREDARPTVPPPSPT